MFLPSVHLVMRKVKPGKVLAEKLQDGLLSVFVTELPTNFERQLFVDISEEIINTRTTELNLSKKQGDI